jgi:hypothetical protein
MQACQGGACVVTACDAGFADCNRKPVDGCEVKVAGDVMNCREFDRWLDAGMPVAQAAEAEAHVLGCARCARLRAAERAIAAAFAVTPGAAAGASASEASAPEGFTDRVMARVAASNVTRRSLAPLPVNDVPWWVAAAAEPATVLAALLMALVLWQPKTMLSTALSVARVILNGVGGNTEVASPERWLGPSLSALISDPVASMGLWLAALPLALWLGYELYRWTERRTVVSIARQRQ